jgi:hypothetical protein
MSLVMTVPIEKEAWVAYWLTPLTSDQKPNNTYMSPPQELKKSYKIPTYGWCFHRLVLNNCWCFPTPLSLVDRILLKNCYSVQKNFNYKNHILFQKLKLKHTVSKQELYFSVQSTIAYT